MSVYESRRKNLRSLGRSLVSIFHTYVNTFFSYFSRVLEVSVTLFLLFIIYSYENGRVAQHGDGTSTCAVAINKAKDGDNGKWTCQISTMDANNNAVSSTADVDVTVAGKKFYISIK